MHLGYLNRICIVGLLILAVILSLPKYNEVADASEINHSSDGWKTASPKLMGVDGELLSKADKFVSGTDAVGMIIIRHGAIIFEKYYRGQLPVEPCFAYPTANSILSALTGIAIEKGVIGSVNQKIMDFFPDRNTLSSDLRTGNIRIQHLLTMTSGFIEPGDDIFRTHDWVGNLLKVPAIHDPGSKFLYSPRTFYLLSAILTKVTGFSAGQLSDRMLLGPIGGSTGIWHTGPEGANTGGEYLCMRMTDMAGFGLLYLNKGRWEGRQIIPEQWVAESLKAHVKLEPPYNSQLGGSCTGLGYGFAVRTIGKHTVYTTEGDGSLQNICIIPELDMVIAISTYHSIFKDTFEHDHLTALLKDYIIPSVREE